MSILVAIEEMAIVKKCENSVVVTIPGTTFINQPRSLTVTGKGWRQYFDDPSGDPFERMLIAIVLSQTDWEEVIIDRSGCLELCFVYGNKFPQKELPELTFDRLADGLIFKLLSWIPMVFGIKKIEAQYGKSLLTGLI